MQTMVMAAGCCSIALATAVLHMLLWPASQQWLGCQQRALPLTEQHPLPPQSACVPPLPCQQAVWWCQSHLRQAGEAAAEHVAAAPAAAAAAVLPLAALQLHCEEPVSGRQIAG